MSRFSEIEGRLPAHEASCVQGCAVDLAWAVARIKRLEEGLRRTKLYFNDSCLEGKWLVDAADTLKHNVAIDAVLNEDS